jgi:hexokinase
MFEELKRGEATVLFGTFGTRLVVSNTAYRLCIDYVANCVAKFLTQNGIRTDEALPLGLNFGFPVEKTSLNSGKLLAWTKGYSVKNSIGKDVAKLLQDAFDRNRVNVQCVAVINDVCYSQQLKSI